MSTAKDGNDAHERDLRIERPAKVDPKKHAQSDYGKGGEK
jgi:hypothetical protein